MTTNYCSNCGTKTDINGIKANFCPKCGQDLKTLKKTVANVAQEIEEDDDIETTGLFDVETLKKSIKVHVDFDAKPTLTVGELIKEAKASGPSASSEPIKRAAAKLPNGKKLLKTIAEECAPSRGKSSEIE